MSRARPESSTYVRVDLVVLSPLLYPRPSSPFPVLTQCGPVCTQSRLAGGMLCTYLLGSVGKDGEQNSDVNPAPCLPIPARYLADTLYAGQGLHAYS